MDQIKLTNCRDELNASRDLIAFFERKGIEVAPLMLAVQTRAVLQGLIDQLLVDARADVASRVALREGEASFQSLSTGLADLRTQVQAIELQITEILLRQKTADDFNRDNVKRLSAAEAKIGELETLVRPAGK